MWELIVIRYKSDEFMVAKVKRDKDRKIEDIRYLTSDLRRSIWKTDGKLYFNEEDALSALIIKKSQGEEPTEETSVILKKPRSELQSWSDLH